MMLDFSSRRNRQSSVSQFVGQSLQVEAADRGRQLVKALHNLRNVLSSLLVGLEISISIHVTSGGIARLEVAEEDVDRDAGRVQWRCRVQPQRRNEEHLSWQQHCLPRMTVGKSTSGAMICLENVDRGARLTGGDPQLHDVRWWIKHHFLRTLYLTEDVGHNLHQRVSAQYPDC